MQIEITQVVIICISIFAVFITGVVFGIAGAARINFEKGVRTGINIRHEFEKQRRVQEAQEASLSTIKGVRDDSITH